VKYFFSRISQCYTTYGGGFSHHAAGISTHNFWVLPTSYLQKKDEKVWVDETYLGKITRERDLVRQHMAWEKEIVRLEKEIEAVEKRNQELREEKQMLVERNAQDIIAHATAETARLQRIMDQLDYMDMDNEAVASEGDVAD
jgi:hypothetical protein